MGSRPLCGWPPLRQAGESRSRGTTWFLESGPPISSRTARADGGILTGTLPRILAVIFGSALLTNSSVLHQSSLCFLIRFLLLPPCIVARVTALPKDSGLDLKNCSVLGRLKHAK